MSGFFDEALAFVEDKVDIAERVNRTISSGATIHMDSRWFPRLSVGVKLPDGSPKAIAPILAFLKPKFTVESPLGTLVEAPAGDPGPSLWPVGVLTLAVVGALAVYAVLHLTGAVR